MRVRASDREHGALLGALEHAGAVLVEQLVVRQLLGVRVRRQPVRLNQIHLQKGGDAAEIGWRREGRGGECGGLTQVMS